MRNAWGMAIEMGISGGVRRGAGMGMSGGVRRGAGIGDGDRDGASNLCLLVPGLLLACRRKAQRAVTTLSSTRAMTARVPVRARTVPRRRPPLLRHHQLPMPPHHLPIMRQLQLPIPPHSRPIAWRWWSAACGTGRRPAARRRVSTRIRGTAGPSFATSRLGRPCWTCAATRVSGGAWHGARCWGGEGGCACAVLCCAVLCCKAHAAVAANERAEAHKRHSSA